MSVAVQTIADNWKIVVDEAIAMNTLPRPRINLDVMRSILAARSINPMSAPVNLPLAADLVKMANQTNGKLNIEIGFEYYERGVTDTWTEICEASEDRAVRKMGTFRLDKATKPKSKIVGGSESLCEKETVSSAFRSALFEVVVNGVEMLARQVEAELLAQDANGYKHIGNLPQLSVAGGTRPAGENLPIYHLPVAGFAAAVNILGKTITDRDKRIGQVPLGTTVIATDFARSQKEALAMQGYRHDGYDLTKMGATPENLVIPSNLLSNDVVDGGAGLVGGMLIIPFGYVQFVSVNLNTATAMNTGTTGKITRGIIKDPYLLLDWDYYEIVEECELIAKRHVKLALHWALISMPKCNINADPALVGTNGIYLYNAVCSNSTICDLPVAQNMLPTTAPEIIAQCEPDPSEMCGDGCSAVLRKLSLVGTTLTLNVSYTLSQGAFEATTIEWAVNGTPVGALDGLVNAPFDTTTLVNGDEITVTVVDNLGCEAVSLPYEWVV